MDKELSISSASCIDEFFRGKCTDRSFRFCECKNSNFVPKMLSQLSDFSTYEIHLSFFCCILIYSNTCIAHFLKDSYDRSLVLILGWFYFNLSLIS